MYKEFQLGDIWNFLEEKSTKLRPSRLEQVVLLSVFYREEYILRQRKADATMADRLIPRDQSHSRKIQDDHLM
jgi:hypothetical protein